MATRDATEGKNLKGEHQKVSNTRQSQGRFSLSKTVAFKESLCLQNNSYSFTIRRMKSEWKLTAIPLSFTGLPIKCCQQQRLFLQEYPLKIFVACCFIIILHSTTIGKPNPKVPYHPCPSLTARSYILGLMVPIAAFRLQY